MSEQQSQKRGVRSDAQKQDDARNDYNPTPATSPVAGAFGGQNDNALTDQDLALDLENKKFRSQR